jgi:putative mRNA 3-end processing factor
MMRVRNCRGMSAASFHASRPPLLEVTPQGLYCAAGGFHIDPWRPVATAVVTHAHSDHARAGSARYVAADAGVDLLRERLGVDVAARAYGERFVLGDAVVSLHPAGHILGSAQVRVEVDGRVVVVSGDYKRDADPTCAPFELVTCDTFITEATFALPVYRWPPIARPIDELLAWWDECARRQVPAVLFCYALGKAQRVLAELAARGIERAIHLHGAMVGLTKHYRDAGVTMPPTVAVADSARGRDFAGELVLAPPSASGSPWMRRFSSASTAFASGWMQVRGARRRQGYDRGFVVSDHADWPSLVRTVRETGARRVLATHGNTDAFVAYLRESGIDAAALRTELGGAE